MKKTVGNQVTYDLAICTIREMSECGKAMRIVDKGPASMEETDGGIVRPFHDGLVSAEGERAATLVRFDKTHPFYDLDSGLQGFTDVDIVSQLNSLC